MITRRQGLATLEGIRKLAHWSRNQCVLSYLLGCGVVGVGAIPTHARASDVDSRPAPVRHVDLSHLDRTGRKRVGNASFYAKKFAGRKMADGTPMQPQGNNAASKTLPLGTTAKVTNLETGQSAIVTIRDRGPYVKDRIVDLSPATAQQIGIDRKEGTAKVEVTPIEEPKTDAPHSPSP